LTYRYASQKYSLEHQAAAQLIYPFMLEMHGRLHPKNLIINFCKRIAFLQFRMTSQCALHRYRFESLLKYFRMELNEFAFGLRKSKNKSDKKLYALIPKINNDLIVALLRRYMERCKFRHSLAFLQFRKYLKNAKHQQISDIFTEKKKYMLACLG